MLSDHDARERAARPEEEELRMSFRKFKDEVNHTLWRFAGRKIEGAAQIRAMHYVKYF